ncbi:hypothetical protein DV515_00004420, partial [Chloebia gouldiae]
GPLIPTQEYPEVQTMPKTTELIQSTAEQLHRPRVMESAEIGLQILKDILTVVHVYGNVFDQLHFCRAFLLFLRLQAW